ncbi:prophage ps3 protein 01 [Rhodococcus rhodochrous KG-21]|uniref:Prophage ps3 protein 01 n=2 Tax=Rhodococcus rhodochrous TaxID=1829 RepID=A0A0M9WMI7_RHORH|nr:prophage ps3 protein 01 [Rhodococcus rhodochrous KG-21]
MASVRDVAAYILQKEGGMSAMKLQKLVYYSQAWHLVWEDKELFPSRIEAWANGPVCVDLYDIHRRKFGVTAADFAPAAPLTDPKEVAAIDAVLKFYGEKSAMYLSDLTHRERPWAEARGDLAPGMRSTAEITQAAMAEYYGSL